jgi:uncharacterized protein (DUF2384 family)
MAEDGVGGDARIARVEALAARVFKDGSAGKEWLETPQGALRGQVPRALVLRGDAGATEVETILHQIECGTYI